MLRFSLSTLLILVAVFAIVCAILLMAAEWLRIITLFIGVLALPGPLVVMCRHGNPASRAFALGGLVSYGVWFTIVGIPCAFHAAAQYEGMMGVSIRGITATSNGFSEGLIVYSYDLFAGLYAPWFVVFMAGIGSLLVHWLVPSAVTKRDAPSAASTGV
jgi:hypothetical protein